MAMMGPGASLRRIANEHASDSLSNHLRQRRFHRFETLAATLPRPLRILDVGGTNGFWEQRGWAERADVQITLVNVRAQPHIHFNIKSTVGSATNLIDYADQSFDVVFSNSVIEHLRTTGAQAAMASEVRRVGRAFWVQTPNFWFPIEPHFLCPGWQWLPECTRVALLRRRRVGWRGPCPDPAQAREAVREIRLLRRRELRRLFPGATITAERWHGLCKSFIVHSGFPTTTATTSSTLTWRASLTATSSASSPYDDVDPERTGPRPTRSRTSL